METVAGVGEAVGVEKEAQEAADVGVGVPLPLVGASKASPASSSLPIGGGFQQEL